MRRACPAPASTAVSAEKLPCLPPPVLRVSKIRRRPARRHPEPRFLKIAFDADRLLFRFGFWSWRGPSTFAEKQFLENRRVPIDLPLLRTRRFAARPVVTPRSALHPGAPPSPQGRALPPHSV